VEKLAEMAVAAAESAGASYADARWIHQRRQGIGVKNAGVDRMTFGEGAGVGVRVIADGAWGFASTSVLTEDAVRATALEAVEIARAAAQTIAEPVALAPVEPAVAEVKSWAQVDPFGVPAAEKLDLLMACDAAMDVPGVVVRESETAAWAEEKLFVSSEGARIYQERVVTQAEVAATAAAAGEVQRRSWPSSHGGEIQARGWEIVPPLDLPAHAADIAREAAELLRADPCPQGKMDIIIESSQLALQLHESCGHPIELDRVLGTEASFAGTSFLTPEKLGSFRYGSPAVSITADPTIPGSVGSFGYDDEGVAARRGDIVREGIFVGYLNSRETALRMGLEPIPAMRADGWNRFPLIRMTNVNLLPGTAGTLEDLIRDTDEGLLMTVNRSWSIDDKRLNFQFACEVAYRIKGGQITGIVRNPSYQGMTPEFWGSCDAICSESQWRVWGVPNCGKGEPMQTMQVGHGVAPARFRQVTVGVAN
jgi:TldD protein